METAARIGVQATESVKRRGLQFSSELKDFVYGLSLRTSLDTSFPLEYKLLGILLLVFLFLIFLIVVLWDRYGKEISELYAPNTSMTVKGDINGNVFTSPIVLTLTHHVIV